VVCLPCGQQKSKEPARRRRYENRRGRSYVVIVDCLRFIGRSMLRPYGCALLQLTTGSTSGYDVAEFLMVRHRLRVVVCGTLSRHARDKI
jgi:hypothetical protein